MIIVDEGFTRYACAAAARSLLISGLTCAHGRFPGIDQSWDRPAICWPFPPG